MESIKIITQVGDTHSLKVADLGKRRFIRLGASEKNPSVMQGTIHTDPIWVSITASAALGNLGLTLVSPETYDNSTLVASYFITGAIAYTVTDPVGGEFVGILASVREVPSEDQDGDGIDDLDAEFTRQYPAAQADDRRVYTDNSVAKELDAILAAWEREKDARMDKLEGDAIARLQALRKSQGGLDAAQKAQFDRLLNARRIAGDGTSDAELDDEPEMLDGRLN